MLVGLLVHNALENLYKKGEPVIDDNLIQEFEVYQETLLLAQQIVLRYQQVYPLHEFESRSVEKALEFPLGESTSWKGISKVDFVFELATPRRVQLNDLDSTELPAGVYGLEHKTRSGKSATWQESWDTRVQADFEILAIQEAFGRCDGILVNTIEYKEPYQPVKTCGSCKERSEVRYWVPVEKSLYQCPLCGEKSEYKPRKHKEPDPFPVYRFLVTRSPEQLERALSRIRSIATEMGLSKYTGNPWMRLPSCTDKFTGKICEYKQLHINNNPTGLVQLENPYEYIYK